MRNSVTSIAFFVAMLGAGRASAAASGELLGFEPTSILVRVALAALVLVAILVLPVLALSAALPTILPPEEREQFADNERPTIPEPSSVHHVTQTARP